MQSFCVDGDYGAVVASDLNLLQISSDHIKQISLYHDQLQRLVKYSYAKFFLLLFFLNGRENKRKNKRKNKTKNVIGYKKQQVYHS